MNENSLIGKKVRNRLSKSIGIIEKIENKKVFVSCRGEINKYSYPDCFLSILELEDEDLQEEYEEVGQEASFDFFKNIYKRGILSEINYLKLTGGKRERAIDGVLLPSQNGEYIYAFDTDTDLHYPDGTAIKIWFPDRVINAYVVSCEEFTIVFRSMEYIGDSVSVIEFSTEQWRLLEALTERLDEMTLKSESIAYELACKGKFQIEKNKSIVCGQNFAYQRATSEAITFIWGPPGTGKTETLSNIALDHIEDGKRVLMVSYSNVSVDGALLRVAKKADYPEGMIVRYGYPRTKELIEDNRNLTSYQCVLNKNPDLAQEYRDLSAEKRKYKKKDLERIDINKRLLQIRSNLLMQEKELIQNACFVATTISKALVDKTIYSQKFDVVIFDEASMAYIPQVVFAASLAKKHFVCMGDFCQLPAIVQNKEDSCLTEDIFSYTKITEAVDNDYSHKWLVMLNVQYRMHKDISDIVNRHMYGGRLITSEEIYASRNEIASLAPMEGEAVSMIDLSFMYSACKKTLRDSHINLLSAMVCLRVAEMFIDDYEVGIITPYSAQSRMILSMIRDLREKDKLYNRIICATVHQFQGSECPVIIYDAVDCFREAYPGVLLTSMKNNNANRLFNVALTRAKGKFILVGNRDFLFRKSISKQLIFTKTMKELDYKDCILQGEGVLDAVAAQNEKGEERIYLGERDDSIDYFIQDLSKAKKSICIDIPGVLDENDEAIQKITEVLTNKQEEGITISIRVEEGIVLPSGLQKFAISKPFVVVPATIVDKKIIWFGHPICSADFITEGEMIPTQFFPCARFEGSIGARTVQAYLEM